MKTLETLQKRRVDHLLLHQTAQKTALAVEQKVKLSAEGRAKKKKKKSLEGVFSSFLVLFGAPGHSDIHILQGEWRKRSGWRVERVSSGAPPNLFMPFPFTHLENMLVILDESLKPDNEAAIIFIYFYRHIYNSIISTIGMTHCRERKNIVSVVFVGLIFPRSSSDSLWAPGSGPQRELLSNWRTTRDVRHLRQNTYFCS